MPNHRRMPCRLGKREDLARAGDARLGSDELVIFYESLSTPSPARNIKLFHVKLCHNKPSDIEISRFEWSMPGVSMAS